MRTIPTFLLFSAAVLAGTDVAFAQRSPLGPTLPSRRVLNRYELERAWWAQAVLNPKRDTVRHLTIDEDMVYVQATSGVVTAFDNESGKRMWAHLLGLKDQHSYPAVSNERLVLIATGMRLYALEKFSGEVQWQLTLPRHPSTSPSIDRQNVYIGSLDGSMYAFSLQEIQRLYEENLLPAWTHEAQMWRFQTGQEITTPAVSTGRLTEFASQDNSLYAVAADRGKRVFQFETDAPVSAPIVESEGLLYLPCEDFKLYCLKAENGLLQWAFPSGLPIRKAPVVVANHVFVIPDRGGIFCLQKQTGEEVWWKPDGTEFLSATPEKVFLVDRRKNVVIVDRREGTPLGALPLRQFPLQLTNDRTDRLYVATKSGLVVCIREQDRDFPLYHKHPEWRPILPTFSDDMAPAPQQPPGPPAP